MTPSTIRCGVRRSSSRSLNVPGSLSSPFTTMKARSSILRCRALRTASRTSCHFCTAGIPAPPSPRRSASLISSRRISDQPPNVRAFGPVVFRLPGAHRLANRRLDFEINPHLPDGGDAKFFQHSQSPIRFCREKFHRRARAKHRGPRSLRERRDSRGDSPL